jgi:dGTPase
MAAPLVSAREALVQVFAASGKAASQKFRVGCNEPHRCYDLLVTRLPAVRERTEELERASLSTWATLALETKGRDVHEEPDPLRTAFQSDRDRILQSAAFRRSKHKTHLLLGEGHRRMRMTHALEVAQIARTIGRGLRLNEDLIETIALGHDVGNTAFGDAGEEALNSVTGISFLHEEQSIRVVESLEEGGRGLNLTWEVRDGILNHRRSKPLPATLEGQAVRAADAIAAVTLDMREASRVGLVDESRIPASVTAALGDSHEVRLAALITDLIASSTDQPELRMTPRVESARNTLQEVLAGALASSAAVLDERNRAVHCLSSLAVYLLQAEAPHHDLQPSVAVCDVVSAHTDGQALAEFQRRFLPSG